MTSVPVDDDGGAVEDVRAPERTEVPLVGACVIVRAPVAFTATAAGATTTPPTSSAPTNPPTNHRSLVSTLIITPVALPSSTRDYGQTHGPVERSARFLLRLHVGPRGAG